ncbi:MAG: ChaN family lipoprotein [Rhodobacteraceae bacterium]|nr:ChaN family lipoprotein [Paracoccaceae bacterium]
MRAGLTLILGLAAAPAGAAQLSVPDAIDAARAAQVVFVGEVHDNRAHHEAQVEFARALAPGALVFEMIRPEDAPKVADLRDDPEALAEALDWANSGWPEFDWYDQIIAAAPEALVLGAQLPRDASRAAVTDGAAQVFGDGAANFGLADPLPEGQQKAREVGQAEAHCDMLPADLLPGMVEIQRLRDAMLARAALEGLQAPGDGPVLVITGNGHAQSDWGAPAALARVAPDMTLFTYGQLEAPPDAAPYDAWRVTDPVARPDPCEAFR